MIQWIFLFDLDYGIICIVEFTDIVYYYKN